MDNERQIQLKYLEEAEDCLDQIESIVIGISNTTPNPQDLDQALRSAHSVKGGAAMMGFSALSQVAHRVEDFFKILRIRYHSQLVIADVETLLLQAIDCMRRVIVLHRQDGMIDEDWLATQSDPIFAKLQDFLGELRPEDEDALLAQEEDIDPALLMFETGVEAAIEQLDAQWALLSPEALRQELKHMAEELADFGRMASLDSFIQLCQSISRQVAQTSVDDLGDITQQILKIWRKSLSLVMLRRLESLPSQLFSEAEQNPQSDSWVEEAEIADLSEVQAAISGLNFTAGIDFELPGETGTVEVFSDFLEIPALSALQIIPEQEAHGGTEFLDINLSELSTELDRITLPNTEPESLSELQEILGNLLAEEIDELPIDEDAPVPSLPSIPVAQQNSPILAQSSSSPAPDSRKTVRVPVAYLQQFNTVFGQLILGRNAVNSRLEQLQSFNSLLQERIQRLEESNSKLRQWYDQASMEGSTSDRFSPDRRSRPPVAFSPHPFSTAQDEFDVLEMDRYSDLHLISQEQIESIVQLQEVTTDIDLSLQEINHSIRDLNQTTRSLQKNMTRMQMVPFSDVVKRFPRVMRDLSLQFNKPVTLKIVGENTLVDRSVAEQLSDPLLHLLRNAFDHGIEAPEARLAASKSQEGQIAIVARHQSGQIQITVSDDGRGIDLDKIRAKLQTLGLPRQQIMAMHETELLDFIFEPGFSTAETLTELSGRGVGMDVVRTNLHQLRGDISVATQPGIGTQFTIQVPFTLSILRAMVLEQAGMVFAVSIDHVKELTRFQNDQITPAGSQIGWQAQTIPLLYLENSLVYHRATRPFEFPNTPTISQPTLLVVGEGKSLTGFHIDRFWGEQEVTIRPIEAPLPLPPGFNNSIVLGDGRVVPLIDPIPLATWMMHRRVQPQDAPERLISAPPTVSEQMGTILIVDDSINVRRYLALTLEKSGYNVEQAKDGQEAVERLLGGLEVQAIVCDIEMPRLDGYGVLATLRTNATFSHLPIAMLTSRSSEKHRKLAMNLGASAYFSKPYNEQELLQKLRELTQQRAVGQVVFEVSS
jgi:chemosensory pili system protein ChpA (sensor histidine kinase/response regulator)